MIQFIILFLVLIRICCLKSSKLMVFKDIGFKVLSYYVLFFISSVIFILNASFNIIIVNFNKTFIGVLLYFLTIIVVNGYQFFNSIIFIYADDLIKEYKLHVFKIDPNEYNINYKST